MINKKFCEGLVFRSSTRKRVEENGETKTAFVTEERPVTPDDVIAFRETKTEMVFVTADGQKYTVAKGKAAEEK